MVLWLGLVGWLVAVCGREGGMDGWKYRGSIVNTFILYILNAPVPLLHDVEQRGHFAVVFDVHVRALRQQAVDDGAVFG